MIFDDDYDDDNDDNDRFVFSCLNSCLVTGDDNDSGKCSSGEDSSCPKGTIYRDIDMSTCMHVL